MSLDEGGKWKAWLLDRQFGGDPDLQNLFLERYLHPIGEKILSRARLSSGQRLLDVGCGTGLLGLLALTAFEEVEVVLADSSAQILHWVWQMLEPADRRRCRLVCAGADALPLSNESVDAVVNRAVLIYVKNRRRALKEYHRVLRPGGHISLFEPIFQFVCAEPRQSFWGYDITPIVEISDKLKKVYREAQSPYAAKFDERELLNHALRCGFRDIHLETRMDIAPLLGSVPWETFVRIAWTPMLPSLEEAMTQTLTVSERAAFAAHLRPQVEANQGTQRWSAVYLWATK